MRNRERLMIDASWRADTTRAGCQAVYEGWLALAVIALAVLAGALTQLAN